MQITRVFDAPRPLVFSYWAQPDKLRLWSGRKDATSVEVEGDFRVGGGFRHKMTIRGAGRHTFSGTYEEIVEPEKIVYSANLGSATIRVIIQFYEQGEQTKVVLTQEGFRTRISSRSWREARTNRSKSSISFWLFAPVPEIESSILRRFGHAPVHASIHRSASTSAHAQGGPMNYPRLAIAAVIGTVVYFAWGYLIEGWLIRDHFLPSQAVYRDISAMQKYMPLGLLSSLLAIFVMAVIFAMVSAAPGTVSGVTLGAFFGLLFGIFAACIHPISNFVTMNIDMRLGLETTASCLVQWTLVGVTIALLYNPSSGDRVQAR